MRDKIFLSRGIIEAIVILVLLVGIGITIAFLFAPQKPEAPPRSNISYEDKPPSNTSKTAGQYDEVLPEVNPPPIEEPTKKQSSQTAPTTEGISDTQPISELKEFSIVVKVIDGRTNQPINGAKVILASAITSRRGPKVQNVGVPLTGRTRIEPYTIRGPFNTDKEGRAYLLVYNTDIAQFKRENIRIIVKSGDYAQGEEVLPEIKEDKPIEITVSLYKGGTIEGKVIEEGTGEGAGGVKILIDEGSNPFAEQGKTTPSSSVISDEKGNFQITGLIPGTYGLYVSIEGTPYLPSKKEFPYKKVAITSPQDVQKGIIFKVSPAGMIWGYVLNMSGEPVTGAELMLTTSQSIFSQAVNALLTREAPNTTTSDDTGYYEMGGVPLNQEWRLYVTAGGPYTPQLSDVFALTPSYRVVRVDVNVFDGTSVSGFVRDTSGNPVPKAEIVCMPEYSAIFSPLDQPTTFRNVTTQEDGSYSITGIPQGNYQLLAWKAGYKVPFSGVKFASDGFSKLGGINITLEPVEPGEFSVFGKVTNPQGEPLSGAEVNLEGVSTVGFQSEKHSTTTDSSGNYRIDGVNIGYYELRVSYPGYVTRTLYSVRFNQPTDVILQTFGVIRGQVLVKETNSPLEQPFTINAAPAPFSADSSGDIALAQYTTEPTESSFTNPEGKFELQLGPGVFELTASSEEYVEGKSQVMVQEGQTADVQIFVSKQGAVVAGKVTIRGSGNPQGTSVYLIQSTSETEAMTRALLGGELSGGKMQVVGEDGVFRFESVAEGDYVIIAQHEGYAMGSSGPITLQAGQHLENITITMGSGGGLEGHVYIDG
ncbi:MAG TPA: carboxypeptidase regulatory-like domain-containing protein, partial [Candidatus Hydrogenedens sp.]|nr:carboxypeptidase regulatory-like domain-containing protein [Candidatus Hydrogenedens sp.]